MNYFVDGYEELHNNEEQLLRQERSAAVEFETFNSETKSAVVKDKGYTVTLESCTCRDFIVRDLPCKHMYKLAARLNLFTNKTIRSRELIADFSKGYADGWAFVVRPCHYAALDIKWQSVLADGEKRGKNSQKQKVLTQGEAYNFSVGQVFYDDIASVNENWGDALKKINVSLQVEFAYAPSPDWPTIWLNGRYVRSNNPICGKVTFGVYKPNVERTRLEKVASYSCRQDEFVALLKTGTFADENGEIITLKE